MSKLIPLLVLLACLVAAAPASADLSVTVVGDRLEVTGDDEDSQILVVAGGPDAYTVTEREADGQSPGAITAEEGCEAVHGEQGIATCERVAGAEERFGVSVFAGGGIDEVDTSGNGGGDYVDCEGGVDFLNRDLADRNDDCETVTPANRQPPAAPGGVVATATSPTSIRLEWGVSPGANAYDVFEFVEADHPEYVTTTSAPTHTVTGLAPLTRHCYALTAANDDDLHSPFTETVCATTPAVAGGGGPGEDELTAAEILAGLIRDARESAGTAARAGITGLLRNRGYRGVCRAPAAGTCLQTISVPGAAAATVLARGSRRVTAAGTYRFKVKLTKKGRKRLRRARRSGKAVRATLTMRFTATGGATARKARRLTLRPKKRRPAASKTARR